MWLWLFRCAADHDAATLSSSVPFIVGRLLRRPLVRETPSRPAGAGAPSISRIVVAQIAHPALAASLIPAGSQGI
jgi:hypothetical protein